MSKNILINLVDRLVANSPIIKEQFSDDPNTFSTQVDDVDFSGLQQYFPEYQDRDMDLR